MNIRLKFDFETTIIYIPDGYVKDIRMLQDEFFEWLGYQEENIIVVGRHLGLSYSAHDFLRFVNNIILSNHTEVAYFINDGKRKAKIHGTLRF